MEGVLLTVGIRMPAARSGRMFSTVAFCIDCGYVFCYHAVLEAGIQLLDTVLKTALSGSWRSLVITVMGNVILSFSFDEGESQDLGIKHGARSIRDLSYYTKYGLVTIAARARR